MYSGREFQTHSALALIKSMGYMSIVRGLVLYFVVLTYYLAHMSCLRLVLAIIFPPLAVIDQGCGNFILVCIGTLFGWLPGVVLALIILK